MKHALPALIAGLLLAATASAAAQTCTAIGSSLYCGARGSQNTVGNTIIFDNGAPGQRIGGFAVTGNPPRTSTIIGGQSTPLVPPRSLNGVATPKTFGGTQAVDPSIARLRAQILAGQAQSQLEKFDLTPAEQAAREKMPPALVRALMLAKEARARAAIDNAKIYNRD